MASAALTLMQARVEFLMNRLRLAAVAGRLDKAWLQSVDASLQQTQSRCDYRVLSQILETVMSHIVAFGAGNGAMSAAHDQRTEAVRGHA